MHNASTVEWYGFQRMRERERALLGEMFPPCVGGPCGDRRDHPFGEYRETGTFDPVSSHLLRCNRRLLHSRQRRRRRLQPLVLSPQRVSTPGQKTNPQGMGRRMGSDRERGQPLVGGRVARRSTLPADQREAEAMGGSYGPLCVGVAATYWRYET